MMNKGKKKGCDKDGRKGKGSSPTGWEVAVILKKWS